MTDKTNTTSNTSTQRSAATEQENISGNLAGVRVIDLTRVLSGPFCTQMLGDHGAEVIKIEPPEIGDVVRGQGWIKDNFSWYFAQFNRNKYSLTLNLRSDEGKKILHQLLETADVLVENFRPGVLDKLGLSDAEILEKYPHLIVARINGFGSTGPYKDRPAYDFIAQAMSGFISVNGDTSSGPMRTAPPMSDLIAGTNLAFGISAALVKRNRTGLGEIVETALTNGLVSMMSYLAAEYFFTGEQPKRTGNDHPILYPYGLFKTADEDVAIAPSNDMMVTRLLRAMDAIELLDDPRFVDNASRMQNKEALRDILTTITQTKTRDEWITLLNEAGVPCGRVMSLGEMFDDDQILAQEMKLELDQGDKGFVPTTGIPVKMTREPGKIHRPVPELGEHTESILTALGIDRDSQQKLSDQGVI